MPYEGRTEFTASEGGERIVAGRAETLRESYQERMKRHRIDLADAARRLGWSFVVHHTDRPPEEVRIEAAILLTMQTMDFVYSTRHTVAL